MLHAQKNRNLEHLWDKELLAFKMGTLKILPPNPEKKKTPKKSGAAEETSQISGKASKKEEKKKVVDVSDVQKVEHNIHVKFDPEKRQYTGLPKEWQDKMHKQFGIELKTLESKAVKGYTKKIPLVLIAMKKYLFANGGLESEGIFRIQPDQEECVKVKKLLNTGSFEKCKDVNAIANLIKVFFRELPNKLMKGVSYKMITDCKNEKDAVAILDTFPEPQKSVMLYLLDMLAEVSKWQKVNKMSPQNLAIVMAPNLFSADNMDPMAGLVFSQKVALFMYKAIVSRISGSFEKK